MEGGEHHPILGGVSIAEQGAGLEVIGLDQTHVIDQGDIRIAVGYPREGLGQARPGGSELATGRIGHEGP